MFMRSDPMQGSACPEERRPAYRRAEVVGNAPGSSCPEEPRLPLVLVEGALSEEGTSRAAIPLSVPQICGNEWRYVKACLDSGWVSSVGPYVEQFERAVAAYVGATHGVATASGTAALQVALQTVGVEPDDEVLVSTLTFIASANAIRYVGAWPVFMDSEPVYGQMDVQKVADFLQRECCWQKGTLRNRVTGRRVRAILPVHILGHPVDLGPLWELGQQYALPIVEDAAEALGAAYGGQRVGKDGDIACFSFNGNKIVTTGGGGMIVTGNAEWARRANYLTTQAKDDPIEFVHHEIGYNYRLSNLQAAVGCAQMEQLDTYIRAKRRIAAAYSEAFADVAGLTLLSEAAYAFSTFWLPTLRVDEVAFGMDSRALLCTLAQQQIQARPLWQPMHRSPAHRHAFAYRIEFADCLHQEALHLPCSVGLTDSDLAAVIQAVKAAGR